MFTIDVVQKQNQFVHKIPIQKIAKPQQIRKMEHALLIYITASKENLWPFPIRAFLLSDFLR